MHTDRYHRREDNYSRRTYQESSSSRHSDYRRNHRDDRNDRNDHDSRHRRNHHYSKDNNHSVDSEGHYVIKEGQYLSHSRRYEVETCLGEGTFGKVVKCYDRDLRKKVAVKIIRDVEKYRDAAKIEIKILETLKQHDPSDEMCCIHLQETFKYYGHVCMVFDIYGLNLFDFLRKNHYKGFPIKYVRSFGRQLLQAISFLHDLTLIHTDLKPENILLSNSEYRIENGNYRLPVSEYIRVIDFGSATFDSDHHTTIISTRHYRAPEVIFELGWTYPCDIWSIGCILLELFTGDALFQTHENREHLAMMEIVFGPIPNLLSDNAVKHAQKYFNENGYVIYPEKDTKAYQRFERHLQRVDKLEKITTGYPCFHDLLSKLLRYDPDERITAKEALQHPFFLESGD